jgi:hypothetical protein
MWIVEWVSFGESRSRSFRSRRFAAAFADRVAIDCGQSLLYFRGHHGYSH